ncbi:putative oxidoreductase UxuB [Pedobacter sp. Bi27]|uniref:SDR family oxidoreductase n=1 Tax=unclassified Pedobacter TaxID=2628915 RepID=UPI001D8CF889|nr:MULTISPECIES: SDR family oxidoreductase [unclassified Pedobacter]CAH0166715.1 putative oxidoreductase UxuB [Pedobacter sp. Bi36]CAH0190708.1 putative oxidoreductase UxuB [Pedobacter sp. Bi27]CAH0222650.1 putative oxidoreductase UxuB [Pedobacter sp. Bi126]
MKTALITGANKSIGFETARQLLQHGYYVYVGSRDIKKGEEAVSQLKLEGLNNLAPIEIDVDNIESIQAAGTLLSKKINVLDVLINNAGISGAMHAALETDINVFRQVFETNFFGVITVTQTFIDLLKQSPAPRIVNVTSGLGSLTLHSDPSWKYYGVKPAGYVSSKAALNAYTILLANNLLNTPFKVNAVDPGYTATDFNHHSGPGTIPDAAARVVKAATLAPDGPTGQFFSDDNVPDTGISPW